MAEIASAFVTIAPSMRGFRSQVTREAGKAGDDASRTIGSRMGKQGRGIGRAFGKAFALGVTGAAAAGAVLLRGAVDEAIEAQKVTATTKQIIKATGGAANISAKQVDALASSISNKVGVDDEAIASGANLLLTFKQVREETGKGNKIFSRATKAAVDLAAAGFGSIESGSKMLGKALNDPLKGITALSRAGVTFSEDQKKLIKDLVASGKILEAQRLILKEVEGQVGGTAAATVTSGEKMRVAWGNVQEELGTALLPVLNDLAFFTRREVLPVISDTVAKLNENRAEIRATAQEWGGNAVEALKTFWGIAKPVLTTLNSIPGPLKEITLQVGLMGGALGKVGFFALTSQLASFRREADGTERSVSRISLAARNAAGLAGMLALARSTQQADGDMKTLTTTAGGAALGFSVGGPWGAAIGGAVGLLSGLSGQFFKTSKAAEHFTTTTALSAEEAAGQARGAYLSLRDSLDQVTGAYTRSTKAAVYDALQKQGAFKGLDQLKLSQRDVVNAVLGNADAQAKVREAMKLSNITTEGQARAVSNLDAALAEVRPELRQSIKDIRAQADATLPLNKRLGLTKARLREIPRKVRIAIQDDVPDSLAEIKALAKQVGGLDKKTVRVLLKAAGLPETKKNFDAVAASAKRVGGAAKDANRGLGKVGKTKPSDAWLRQFRADIAGGKSAASSGGSAIGSALGAGINSGIGSWVSRISNSAASAVSYAVQAAKKAGKVKSPSRLMAWIGKMLGLGLAKGIDGTKRTVGLSMDRVMDALEAGVKKKDIGKRLAKHVRVGLKAIEREVGQLHKLITARDDLASGVAGGLRGEFDLSAITSGGEPNEFGFAAKAQPVKAAQAIVARMKAFAAKISALVRAKFPAAIVQEIAGMGSLEGGKVASEFLRLSAGDRGALLKSYSDIATYSQSIGKTVANQQYGKKIRDQRDVVDAMERGIERGLKKVHIDVQLGVDKRSSAKIYLVGKKEAEAKR